MPLTPGTILCPLCLLKPCVGEACGKRLNGQCPPPLPKPKKGKEEKKKAKG